MKETFGERLQELRNREGLTLEGLANEIGSTKSYVWELENKPNIRPSAELVYKLSKSLKTTVGVLMGEVEDISEADQVFFRDYKELNPETKKQLGQIMDVLMDEDDGDGD